MQAGCSSGKSSDELLLLRTARKQGQAQIRQTGAPSSNSGDKDNGKLLYDDDCEEKSAPGRDDRPPGGSTAEDRERNEFHHKNSSNRNRSGPLLFRQMKDSRPHLSGAPDEPSEGNVVQRRGRFQVTSDKTAQKVASASSSRTNLPSGVTRQTSYSSTILPTLQFLMQQNTMQKEVLSRLISSIEETSDASDASIVGSSQSSGALVREKEMESYVVNLQRSVTELAEEVQRLKLRNNQLEQQINALSKDDERLRREDKK